VATQYTCVDGTFGMVGTPTTTAIAGSATGPAYSTTSTSFTAVDATNLSKAITIPNGYKCI
jgi:hypothetical protein